ncbi:ABC transporter permease [Desulfosporosinus meridiei]|uniref:ABC-type dipeptide/oligopeptide/nickel transport system, permease component n=1 Tax=Desulfosporosinus meridiei (strain ATCC BAA-275 / DSM 13257 / KCTC 12902 / NCIMB 13706 / S10) TaxID=768704 RepID=J7J1W3_DESMD|nr:ABC transporter permease [Desulfosporosinus meridiei]AFQ44956.1 ABC-type dipeptide/oligopeptide/nickel transport system, permease component [Desulfosporosinus meridiei DSM 13257]
MGLLKYIARRLFFLVFLVIGVSLVVFVISHSVPSDPVLANLSQRNIDNPEMVEAFKAKWGMDKPLYTQYFIYVGNLVQGDLGTSIRTQRPVLDDLQDYFPATIELAIFSIIIAIIFGMLFGIISAIKRNSAMDQLIRGISVLGVSVPSFWLGLMFLLLFYVHFGIAPGPGRISPYLKPPVEVTHLYVIDALLAGNWSLARDALWHLLLPGLVLGSFTMGLITRTTRSSLLEVMSLDFIRTARAKGLTEKMIIMRHALGNALIPVVTVIGIGFGNLLGGMVLVETIFAWPGIGQYAYKAAGNLDFPAIIGVSILISINYVVINLLVDILYGILDPRVRYH